MGYVVSQLQAVLSLEDRGFSQGMKNAQQETKKTAQTAEETGNRIEKVGSSLARLGSSLTVGITAPLVLMGKRMVEGAVRTDSMRRSLEAVEGSAAKAEARFRRLIDVAKVPGLGFEEAVKGYVNLRAAGLAANDAERALRGFGNALATVGKGKEDLEGVILALTQIQSKGKVSAEEINQLAERVPQIRQIMKDAFGTADTELIQKAGISADVFVQTIIGATEKLARANGGLKNDMDNAMESIDRSLSRLGTTLAPKAARGLEVIADKVEKLSLAWDKLPKEQQDLLTYLGLGALAAGPATVLLGNLAGLAVNLKELGLSLGTVGRLGVAALPILAAVMAFKPHWDMAKDTAKNEQNAKENNAYFNSSKLGQSMQARTDAGTLKEYLGFLNKGQGAYEFLRANRGPNFNEISSLLDRELGTDRRDDTAAKVRAAIAKLEGQAKKAKADFDKGRVEAYGNTIKDIFKGLVKPTTPKLSAAEMAAQKKAEQDAAKERERQRKQAEKDRQTHAQNFARNTQEGKDQLYLDQAPNEFERRRRQAEIDLRENNKRMDKGTAKSLYDSTLSTINNDRREYLGGAITDGLGRVGDLFSGIGKRFGSAADRMGKKQEQDAKRRRVLQRRLELQSVKGNPYREAITRLMHEREDMLEQGYAPSEVDAWVNSEMARVKSEYRERLADGLSHMPDRGTVQMSFGTNPDGTSRTGIEALRMAAQTTVSTISPEEAMARLNRSMNGFYSFRKPSKPSTGSAAGDAMRRYMDRMDWAYTNAYAVSGDISRASGGFAQDMLSGRSAKEAGRRMKDSLIEALNQGAAREIERVVARSITDPIAKAIERGLDPLAEKLAHSLEVSTKGLRMSTQQIISSAYSLLAMSQRKKKFGWGTALGLAAGIATGGSFSTVMALANVGNAVDNNDYNGALYGGLNLFTQGSWDGSGAGGNAPGNTPADGRAVIAPSVVHQYNYNVQNNGWTVNNEADENRILSNMSRRIRVASIVQG